MKVRVTVDGGICGFQTSIRAESADAQNVTLDIASGCEKVRKFGEHLAAKGSVDGYAELGAGSDGIVLTTARENLKGCCSACAVPVGSFTKDVTLKIEVE